MIKVIRAQSGKCHWLALLKAQCREALNAESYKVYSRDLFGNDCNASKA